MSPTVADSDVRQPRRALAGLPLLMLVALAISAGVGDPAPALLGAASAQGRLVLPQERKATVTVARRQQDRPFAAPVARAAGQVRVTDQPARAMAPAGVPVRHHVRVERTSLPPPRA